MARAALGDRCLRRRGVETYTLADHPVGGEATAETNHLSYFALLGETKYACYLPIGSKGGN